MAATDDFYRIIEGPVEARKVKNVKRELAIRLYCYQSGSTWTLQIRSPIRLASGGEGKDFIVSTAQLDLDDMVALRRALTLQIDEAKL